MYETVVGRLKEDLAKFGTQAAGYIGRHIVGTGEDAHLTTKVFMDFLRPHIVLVCGKRGYGKSYTASVIAEEIAMLPEEFRKNLSVVMIDTMGIFWSMKKPNDQQSELLREWDLEPKGLPNVKVFIPFKQKEEFEKAGIPFDAGISILPYEFSADEWRLSFNLSATEPAGISLEKNVNELSRTKPKFTIEDLITKIKDDKETSTEVKDALKNMLTVADQWGVFGEQGVNIEHIVQPGQISVIDISHLRATESWSVRNLLVAILARKIYQYRLMARKEEEVQRVEEAREGKKYPMVWMMIDEAHNFAGTDPSVSLEPLLVIAKQGREPGVGLLVITQMPNKIHQDILSQCDLIFSHRLTSKTDLHALHEISQTYMTEDFQKYINFLPRHPGNCIVVDDNLEKVFTVNIRPRISWHSGGTAALV
ncbi:MAG TPA: ATP-binding protein [archaeon]|nr:ATP-binding protein [archaeon]